MELTVTAREAHTIGTLQADVQIVAASAAAPIIVARSSLPPAYLIGRHITTSNIPVQYRPFCKLIQY